VVSHYEALRLDVINGASSQVEGWVLFVRSGMRSWCEHCQQSQQPPVFSQRTQPVAVPVVTPLENALVQVLAGMVLNLQQGELYRV